jgi:hypothetical protein
VKVEPATKVLLEEETKIVLIAAVERQRFTLAEVPFAALLALDKTVL